MGENKCELNFDDEIGAGMGFRFRRRRSQKVGHFVREGGEEGGGQSDFEIRNA